MKKIERLVIGSRNKAKVEEWRKFLDGKIELLELGDFDRIEEPEENGLTFRENAYLKAVYYSKILEQFVLSDDGGLEVEALGGRPGVKSRRVLTGDREGTDEECIEYIYFGLKGLPIEKRAARSWDVAVIAGPSGEIVFEDEGGGVGYVPEQMSSARIEGFPYRSVLALPQFGRVYAELSNEELDSINHRKKMSLNIVKFIKETNGDG